MAATGSTSARWGSSVRTGDRTVTQFPGHREGVVCERWLDALAAADVKPAVVEAGVHYDGLDREGISEVLGMLEELLREVMRMFD